MAKTHLSLSHDAALLNAPTGFTVTVRDVRAYTGAGWLVPLLGDMQTMPGLGASPAAHEIDIDAEGHDRRALLASATGRCARSWRPSPRAGRRRRPARRRPS